MKNLQRQIQSKLVGINKRSTRLIGVFIVAVSSMWLPMALVHASGAPVNSSPPTISGVATQSDTLTASTGTWTNSPSSYTYQWEDCTGSGGTGCSNVSSGGTSSTYTLQSSDVGDYMVVAVTATNGSGSSSPADSVATGVVLSAPPATAALTMSPSTQTVAEGSDATVTVTITPTTGDSINTVQSVLTYNAADFTLLSITPGSGFTGGITTVPSSLGSANGSVEFSAYTSGGGAVTATQTAVTIVLQSTGLGSSLPISLANDCATGSFASTCSAAYDTYSVGSDIDPNDLVASASITPADVTVNPPAPVNSTVPTISGTTTQGQVLTATNGTWTNSPSSYTYQWEDCTGSGGTGCSNVSSGGTSSTYTLQSSDVGDYMVVAVTATNSGGASSPADSAATTIVNPPAPVNSTAPTISGTTTQGQVLTATNGTWTNSPSSYTYQWEDCTGSGGTGCSNVSSGGTSSTYTLQSSDVGDYMVVAVTAHNSGGASSPADSAATTIVIPLVPVNSGIPTVSGTAAQGDVLTVSSNGTWTNSPSSYTYQWEDCTGSGGTGCSNVSSGGTSNSYTVTSNDVGDYMVVAVTAHNSGGASSPANSAATAKVIVPTCTNPTTPGMPSETSNTYTTISLSWSASTAGSGGCTLTGYYIFRNGTQIGNVTSGTSYTDSGLSSSTNYSYTVQAYDNDNDTSAQSAGASLPTETDNLAPTAPTGLTATLVSNTQINLSWTASTDLPNPGGVGVKDYNIYRCTDTSGSCSNYSKIGTSNGTTTNYSDTTASDTTTYNYEVTAVDNSNNESADSTNVSPTTFTCTTSGSQLLCDVPNGTNFNFGALVPASEVLTVDGSICNTTVQSGGILKGLGSVCNLIVQSGGIVAPGHSPGTLTVNGSYTLNGTYTVDIQSPGNTAGTDYDQIIVTGAVNLTGGTLDTEFLNGFTPTVGQTFEIINNKGGSAITGTFAGLPEGAVFAVGSTKLQITYKGGSASDSVILTVVNPNTPVTGSAPGSPDTGLAEIVSNPLPVLFTTIASTCALIFIARRLKPIRP